MCFAYDLVIYCRLAQVFISGSVSIDSIKYISHHHDSTFEILAAISLGCPITSSTVSSVAEEPFEEQLY